MSNAAVKVELVRQRGGPFTDTLYGTGVTWGDIGDVREVPTEKWAQMKRHADVWREAKEPIHEETQPVPSQGLAAAAGPEGKEQEAVLKSAGFTLVGMSDDQVKAFVAAEGLKVDGRLRSDNLKAAATEAYQAKVAAAGEQA